MRRRILLVSVLLLTATPLRAEEGSTAVRILTTGSARDRASMIRMLSQQRTLPLPVLEALATAASLDGGASALDVRFHALELLARHPLPPSAVSALAERLAIRGGEPHDFIRILIPPILAASRTPSFDVHLFLAGQIAGGGGPRLQNAAADALEALQTRSEAVGDRLASAALNPEFSIAIRHRMMRILAAIPQPEDGHTTMAQLALVRALQDPRVSELAAELLGHMPGLSPDTLAYLDRIANSDHSSAPLRQSARAVMTAQRARGPILLGVTYGDYPLSCGAQFERIFSRVLGP